MSNAVAFQAQQFNRLRAPERGPTQAPNHYHFSVRTLPIVEGDAVFLVNPYINQRHCEGRTRIKRLSLEAQAEVIVPLLFESFLTTFDNSILPLAMDDPGVPWAPYSWSTPDAGLAQAVSARLRAVGVRPDLCHVSVADSMENDVADTLWKQFSNELIIGMGGIPEDQGRENVDQKCAGCGTTPSLDKPLRRCAQCQSIYYCSRVCQRGDWKKHKVNCK
ncbi:hypothetical protein N7466_009319 [Penicillium verhagenii]|uniref:uncharacterized protein n=1 Tax=Penicillium verhagenii TaxID=1562060 RepID=UPI002544E49D|nr:uncharacterized protein N7466_009319 [Penicillium verhagenii]KAJ5920993.1 hypothetical protein N7466_009319 [Penicillium verhagenii]